jgi:hypothetical protein
MRSHINFVSIELWRIIEQGFHPSSKDLKNLQPWELIDKQLNASALHLIHMSLSEKDKAFVRNITSAKDAWDALANLFIGNKSIQESKYDEAHNEADNFAMLDGEIPKEFHRRLSALQVKLIDLGSTQCDGKWMKRKFIQALLPFIKDTVNSIKGDANFWKMTARDILQEIVAIKIFEKNANDALAQARGVRAPNLALKAKVSYHEEASLMEEGEIMSGSPDDMKYAHAEHMALAQRAFMKKWKSSSPSKPKARSRVRTCYNCGNQNYFIVDCPYERVEDHNGRLVCKEMRAKSYPPRNSYKKKAVPIHALMTQEEYPFGDDASNNEEVGRAAIAIAISKPTSSSSLFASANDSKCTNNKGTCLMAHATKVSLTLTPIIPRSLSLMDCVDSSDDKDELSEMDIFMSTLHGETKARFEILLDQYNESLQLNNKKEEHIFELEGHAREYADEIATLTQSLEVEQDLTMALEVSKLGLEESHNLDIARLKSDRDIAQSVANELRLQNEKLNLIIAKEATKFPSSTFTASSCHTNPLYEKDPPNGDKRLDELLSAQKQHGDKTVLGFISKSKKNRNKKKNNNKKKFLVPTRLKKRIPNDICFDEDGNVSEEEGELVKEVVGNAKRAMPNHNNFSGKYNPSYVLCRDYDRHV